MLQIKYWIDSAVEVVLFLYCDFRFLLKSASIKFLFQLYSVQVIEIWRLPLEQWTEIELKKKKQKPNANNATRTSATTIDVFWTDFKPMQHYNSVHFVMFSRLTKWNVFSSFIIVSQAFNWSSLVRATWKTKKLEANIKECILQYRMALILLGY